MDMRCIDCKSRFPLEQDLGPDTWVRCTCERDRKNLKTTINELHRRGLECRDLEREYIDRWPHDQFARMLK
jgi:hypothetical protein